MEDFINMLKTMVETLKAHNLKETSFVIDSSDGDYEIYITIEKK